MKKFLVLFTLVVFIGSISVSLIATPSASLIQVLDKDPKKAPANKNDENKTCCEKKDATCCEKKNAACCEKSTTANAEKKECCNDKEKK